MQIAFISGSISVQQRELIRQILICNHVVSLPLNRLDRMIRRLMAGCHPIIRSIQKTRFTLGGRAQNKFPFVVNLRKSLRFRANDGHRRRFLLPPSFDR